MAAPIPLRGDFDACQLRVLARKSKDGPQARRLLALAAIYEGATRSDAAKIGGVGLQIIRDWVLRLNARGPDGLLDGKAPGQPSKLNDAQRHAVARMIETGPIPRADRPFISCSRYLIKNASFLSFRFFISSLIQRGVAPRPAQVSLGLALLLYLGATFRPFIGLARRPRRPLPTESSPIFDN